jgi:hypothetical protein
VTLPIIQTVFSVPNTVPKCGAQRNSEESGEKSQSLFLSGILELNITLAIIDPVGNRLGIWGQTLEFL